MYYIEPYFDCWIIKKFTSDDFAFGPFESESDAHLVSELLNQGKLIINVGYTDGKKDIEESYSIHKHVEKRTV